MRNRSIMLLVTYGCNLRCNYCYEPKRKHYRMDYETAISAIQKHLGNLPADCESIEIQFMGGEPFLEFPLIKAISEWVWSNQRKFPPIALFAQTNGTLVHGDIKDWLHKNNHRFNVALSFDGTIAMQAINRKSSDIDLSFFATNWPDQNIKMTISPETVAHIYDGVCFLHNQGFKHVAADLAMGESIGWQPHHLTIYRDQLHKLVGYYTEHPDIEPFSQLRLNVFALQSEEARHHKTCGCGEDLVCIDWNGDEYACHLFAPISISKEKATASQKIDFTKHDEFISKPCKECALRLACNQCYGMNYICTGDVAQPSPFHCNAFKLRYAANMLLTYEKMKQTNQKEALLELNDILESFKI